MEENQEQNDNHNIGNLNKVNEFGIVEPQFIQDLSAMRTIDFAFLPDEKVAIIAHVNWEYPYWVSVTDVKDIDTNSAILKSIMADDFNCFTKSSAEALKELLKDRYQKSFYVLKSKISTSFGVNISSSPDQMPYWNKMMSKIILEHYKKVKDLCKIRECNGKYAEILKDYLNQLKSHVVGLSIEEEYNAKRGLIELIRAEDYLLLSDDENIRNLYIEAEKECNSIGNSNMSAIR